MKGQKQSEKLIEKFGFEPEELPRKYRKDWHHENHPVKAHGRIYERISLEGNLKADKKQGHGKFSWGNLLEDAKRYIYGPEEDIIETLPEEYIEPT